MSKTLTFKENCKKRINEIPLAFTSSTSLDDQVNRISQNRIREWVTAFHSIATATGLAHAIDGGDGGQPSLLLRARVELWVSSCSRVVLWWGAVPTPLQFNFSTPPFSPLGSDSLMFWTLFSRGSVTTINNTSDYFCDNV